MPTRFRRCTLVVIALASACAQDLNADHLRELQQNAKRDGQSPAAHWGTDPNDYEGWGNHSSRLIPVYTFGTSRGRYDVNLSRWSGTRSPYRSPISLRRLYGQTPSKTHNPNAEYFDQTNLYDLQKAALEAGKKHIFVVVFDGMDWQTTQAASIYKTGKIGYTSGRGTGLHFQDYKADGTSQFGAVVTSPRDNVTRGDVDEQETKFGRSGQTGGYDVDRGGPFPWSLPNDPGYLIGKGDHAFPDSAATATAICSGTRTYNGAIGVDRTGAAVDSIVHLAQRKYRMSVGAVTSVPISHATPGSAYAHNVTRNDYQDITRDLLGQPSIFHPKDPLTGMDVVIGAGYGIEVKSDRGQGKNFVAGNKYIAESDLKAINVENGGRYIVAMRTAGKAGGESISEAAQRARSNKQRLFGFYGAVNGHLPYQTADGEFNPVQGRKAAEEYSPADLAENPTLAEMTDAALHVLSADPDGFWLMVEPGDVDWANHDNNLDNSIGAVLSGDDAVKRITEWVEKHSSWDESLMIVTADHGHMLVLDRPELLIDPDADADKTNEANAAAERDAVAIPKPGLMAHRGMSALAPENTIAAFDLALTLRYDIELDVYQTQDDKLVVIHDRDVSRTTNGTGDVTKMTLSDLRKLDAGSWSDPVFANEKVPQLEEVLNRIRKRQRHIVRVAINLKTLSDGIEANLAKVIADAEMTDQCFCFGMSQSSNALLKRADERIQTGIATTSFTNFDLRTEAGWMKALKLKNVDLLWTSGEPQPEWIDAAHKAGKQVWIYANPQSESTMQSLLESNADGVCSDYVQELRAVRRAMREDASAAIDP